MEILNGIYNDPENERRRVLDSMTEEELCKAYTRRGLQGYLFNIRSSTYWTRFANGSSN